MKAILTTRWLALTLGLILLIYLLSINIYHQVRDDGMAAALIMSGIDPSTVHKEILDHYKSVLPEKDWDNLQEKDINLQTTFTDINNDSLKDLLVVFKSPLTCGSGGCLSTIFLQNDKKEFEPLNAMYAVKSIKPLGIYTMDMQDLEVNDNSLNRLVWNGTTYEFNNYQ
jgi:hypothetical protein